MCGQGEKGRKRKWKDTDHYFCLDGKTTDDFSPYIFFYINSY